MTAHLRLITPSNENRSVPVRPPNSDLRTREYLTPKEVEKLIKAAKGGRWGHRDATLVLVAFRHGFAGFGNIISMGLFELRCYLHLLL
jgi:hypothetical protein